MKTLIVALLVAFVAAEQKREAEPSYLAPLSYGYGVGHHYGYRPAVAYHPYGGRSYVQSYNHRIYKREAEAEAEPGYGFPSYGYGLGHLGYGIGHRYGYGQAIAHHPYGGHSYVQSYNHIIHKRDADPEPGYLSPSYGHGAVFGYSSSVAHPGYGHSYQYRHGVVPARYGYY